MIWVPLDIFPTTPCLNYDFYPFRSRNGLENKFNAILGTTTTTTTTSSSTPILQVWVIRSFIELSPRRATFLSIAALMSVLYCKIWYIVCCLLRVHRYQL